jgi:hypothetical protein
MRFYKIRDKDVWVQTLDYSSAVAETKHLRWYVCDMWNHMHEIRHVLCGTTWMIISSNQ